MSRRFQFSIRFLLAATVAVAAGVSAVRYDGPLAMTAVPAACLTMLFATAAVVGAIRTSGKLRTFWIGNAIFLVLVSFHAVSVLSWLIMGIKRGEVTLSSYQTSDVFWPFWCAAPVNGLFAIFLDWLFSPRRDGGP